MSVIVLQVFGGCRLVTHRLFFAAILLGLTGCTGMYYELEVYSDSGGPSAGHLNRPSEAPEILWAVQTETGDVRIVKVPPRLT